MSMIKFENEYEMRASQKILFPYLNTPGGLSQWFADDVSIDEDKIYHFQWSDQRLRARMAGKQRDQFVRFDYLPDTDEEENTLDGDGNGRAYVELSLEKNELTQSVYLRVVDYSEMEDEEELRDLWDSMISSLKETVGG